MSRPRYGWTLTTLALIAALAASCKDPGPPAESVAGEDLVVRDARAHVLPGMGHGAAYFIVENRSNRDDRLLRVETDAALVAELHETIDQDGVMRMIAHPEGVPVPAEGSVVFAPGGKHVMLIEPRIGEGTETISLILAFEHAGEVGVEASLMSFER